MTEGGRGRRSFSSGEAIGPADFKLLVPALPNLAAATVQLGQEQREEEGKALLRGRLCIANRGAAREY